MYEIIVNEKTKTELVTSDFYYDLPAELIAQHPMPARDASRLMVLDRATHTVTHRHFYDIVDYLHESDVLVINDSKVIPARIFGHAAERAEAMIELLLLRQRALDTWEVLVKPGKRAKIGARLVFGEGELVGTVTDIVAEGNRLITFEYDRERYANIYDILHRIGTMPLPPYITERLEDQGRYQTVYAHALGSMAAPTVGLHFTPELIEEIKKRGAKVVKITLHVGAGTWKAVTSEKVADHRMHSEWGRITQKHVDIINKAKRVIAVGTTSLRLLETAAKNNPCRRRYKRVAPFCGTTRIFITPGFRFRAVDVLLTNFHLPQSTLFMLVSAFSGMEQMKAAYSHAVAEKYRFFSYGDCCLLFKKEKDKGE